jgi:hypothetical protein
MAIHSPTETTANKPAAPKKGRKPSANKANEGGADLSSIWSISVSCLG